MSRHLLRDHSDPRISSETDETTRIIVIVMRKKICKHALVEARRRQTTAKGTRDVRVSTDVISSPPGFSVVVRQLDDRVFMRDIR